jgi:hypothetical protein
MLVGLEVGHFVLLCNRANKVEPARYWPEQQRTISTMKSKKQMEKPSDDQKLLTRRDVAERWACCEHTVARCEDLKPIRFNRRRLRYRLENVVAVEKSGLSH